VLEENEKEFYELLETVYWRTPPEHREQLKTTWGLLSRYPDDLGKVYRTWSSKLKKMQITEDLKMFGYFDDA